MQSFPDIFNLRKVNGLIGVEIEVEASEELPEDCYRWNAVEDGSLRGYSKEYVLNSPIDRDALPSAIDVLTDHLSNYDVDMNRRTSVHVHINTKDMNVVQVFNFITLFTMLENQLIDDSRKGNMFCLRARDAEHLFYTLRSACLNQDMEELRQPQLRYAALNVNALSRYGSLEFRSKQGTLDKEEILQWVDRLLDLMDVAMRSPHPSHILENVRASWFNFDYDMTKANTILPAAYFNNIDWSNIVWLDEPLTDV